MQELQRKMKKNMVGRKDTCSLCMLGMFWDAVTAPLVFFFKMDIVRINGLGFCVYSSYGIRLTKGRGLWA